MQTRNNYQLEWEIRTKYGLSVDKGTGVFNGDMGIVREINDFAETMTVEFDEGRMVEYPYKLLDELELAYAITIHKSQGSEYPAVVIPLLSGPSMLMNRNLLYTAVTRARKCVTLVGNEVTFEQMVQNTSQQKRYSGLCDRLERGIALPQLQNISRLERGIRRMITQARSPFVSECNGHSPFFGAKSRISSVRSLS